MITIEGIDPMMIANNLTPSDPIHPGELIKDEIESRGLKQRSLAQKMGVSYSVLNEILNGKRPVSTEYALMFEAALGIDANIWLKTQADYNLQMAKRNILFVEKLKEIRRAVAVL
ncbi:MAG: HigA family addiction module antitoxin [Bacteroidales bacterium]|nr:HigA family addiction module antitoxin [Bacteroidales bacterium]